MIGFLLALIPAPWLAVVRGLPWRLIGIVTFALGISVVALVANGWRLDSNALEATREALATSKAEVARYAAREARAWQALREEAGKAAAKEAADKATAERIEHDLQTKLAAADARGRDLARRLSNAARAACPGAQPVPGAAPAAVELAGAAGEPGDAGGVGEALAAHLSACESDANRLQSWIDWWVEVSAGR